MGQSSPDFFRQTLEESLWIPDFSDFGYLQPFRKCSRSKSDVVRNRAEFCMSLAQNFLWEARSCSKILWRSAEGARGSRAEKKNHEQLKTARNYRPERPNSSSD